MVRTSVSHSEDPGSIPGRTPVPLSKVLPFALGDNEIKAHKLGLFPISSQQEKMHLKNKIMVDSFSGWPEVFVCEDRSSATVLKALKSVFARFGVPRMLVTDHAKEFISEEIRSSVV